LRFFPNYGNLILTQRAEAAFEILELQIEAAALPREAVNDFSTAECDRDEVVAGSNARSGIDKGTADFFDGHFAASIGKIRPDGCAAAANHVAGAASARTEEKSLSRRRVARRRAFGRRQIQRTDKSRQRLELGSRQIE